MEPKNPLSPAVSTGLRVVVHNQSRTPSLYEAILIPIGQQSIIEVNRMFKSLPEQPYSNCLSNIGTNHPSKLVKLIFLNNYTYNQQDCFHMCYQLFLIGRCNCFGFPTLLSVKSFTNQNYKPCLNYSQIVCNGKVGILRHLFIFI